MAINRAPFTALIEDDGSNTVGSVWNKAAIQNVLLDPMDAAFAPPWLDLPYSAGNYAATGGGWTLASQTTYAYQIDGKTLTVMLYLQGTTVTGSPTSLNVALPTTPIKQTGQTFPFGGTSTGAGFASTSGSTLLLYRDILGTPWIAGTIHLAGVFHFVLP